MHHWLRLLRLRRPGRNVRPGAPRLALEALETRCLLAITACGQALTFNYEEPASGVVATFSDTNPGLTPSNVSDLSATIDWGDGTTSAGTISSLTFTAAGVSGQVNGSHSYAQFGGYQITVTIHDALDNATGIATATANAVYNDLVGPVCGNTLTFIEGQAATGVVATFADSDTDAGPSNFSATINWGDGTTSSGTISNLTFTETGISGQVNGTHAYAEFGVYQMTVTVTDSLAPSTGTATSTALVADAPLVGPVGIPVCGVELRPLVNVPVAQFTDTGGLEPGSDYTATINWGDGTPVSAGTVFSSDNGTLTVVGSHVYFAEGDFPVTVSIQDIGGSTNQAQTVAMIGGFVTSVYQDVLGRLPSAAELNFWQQLLRAGVSRTEVAELIWDSPEHRGLEVNQMYETFFNRAASPAELTLWVNALDAGVSEGDVAIALLTSAEYTASHPDAASYVVGLYTDILGRLPSAGEAAFWEQVLQSGARSRAAVAYYFLSSPEADVDAITDYYETFLGRAPDPLGESNFLAAIANGATPVSIVGAILGSDEFFDRVLSQPCI